MARFHKTRTAQCKPDPDADAVLFRGNDSRMRRAPHALLLRCNGGGLSNRPGCRKYIWDTPTCLENCRSKSHREQARKGVRTPGTSGRYHRLTAVEAIRRDAKEETPLLKRCLFSDGDVFLLDKILLNGVRYFLMNPTNYLPLVRYKYLPSQSLSDVYIP